jgi:hypothetical protein
VTRQRRPRRPALRGLFARFFALVLGAVVAAALIVGMQVPLLHPAYHREVDPGADRRHVNGHVIVGLALTGQRRARHTVPGGRKELAQRSGADCEPDQDDDGVRRTEEVPTVDWPDGAVHHGE